MSDLDFMPLFLDFYERYDQLSYEERGRLVWAMLAYARDEDPGPHLTENLRLYAFNNEKGMLDRTKKTYAERKKRRKEASLAAHAARYGQTANRSQSQPIAANRIESQHNENENKNKNENENKNENKGGARTYGRGRTRSADARAVGQETIL